MNKTLGRLLVVILTLSVAVFSLSADAATVYVTVSFFQLSPDPVNVKSGDTVYWQDGDDLGPYLITAGSQMFGTPGQVVMNVAPGSYSYSAESSYGGGSFSGTINVSPNVDSPPSVTITSPTNGQQFAAPGDFTFSADATDPDPNDIWDVQFFVGTNMVDDVYSPPYSTSVTNLPAGSYTLTAIVWDFSAETATNSVNITVVNSSPISLGTIGFSGGNFTFSASNLTVGNTNVLLYSSNLVDWVPVQTNVADSSSVSFTNSVSGPRSGFYRLMQMN